MAADLRRILAIRTMATDLERVGDLSRNIAKSAARLAERPPVPLPALLDELVDQTTRVLRDALDSFTETDSAKAQLVIDADDEIDATEDRLIQAVIADVVNHPEKTNQQVDFILIAKNLERVGDHATNIAEEVIFLAEARIVRHREKLGGERSQVIVGGSGAVRSRRKERPRWLSPRRGRCRRARDGRRVPAASAGRDSGDARSRPRSGAT